MGDYAEFCSEEVKDEVVKRLMENKRQATIDRVLNGGYDRLLHYLHNHLLESVVRDVFRAKYDLYMHEFKQLEDLEELSHRFYYKPRPKNFGTIDAFHMWTEGERDVSTVVEMLQMTVSHTHHIFADCLSRVVKFLKKKHCSGTDLVLQYTFVVPKCSELRCEQSFTTTTRHAREAVAGIFDGVQQFRRTCHQNEDGSLDITDAVPLAVGGPRFYNRPQSKRRRTDS